MIFLFKYISCSYLSKSQYHRPCIGFKFKYISCSYLSQMLLQDQTFLPNSNTSHVLIYPCLRMPARIRLGYSNTSHVLIYPDWEWFITFTFSFKYISCSYLSDFVIVFAYFQLNSNTSHVLIYPVKSTSVTPALQDSNTSHVLIYQSLLYCKSFL